MACVNDSESGPCGIVTPASRWYAGGEVIDLSAYETKEGLEATLLEYVKVEQIIQTVDSERPSEDKLLSEKAFVDEMKKVDTGGDFIGSSAKFADLPIVGENDLPIEKGDYSILTENDNEYKRGVYQWNGSEYHFSYDIGYLTRSGVILGNSDTYATLPKQDSNGRRALSGDFAILTSNDRDHQRGLYKLDDSEFVLVDASQASLNGHFIGSSDTYDTLPQIDGISNGDWAILRVTDGEEKQGIYIWDTTNNIYVFKETLFRGGSFIGSATKYDDLPKVDNEEYPVMVGDTALLTTKDADNLPGIYKFNGAWELAIEIQPRRAGVFLGIFDKYEEFPNLDREGFELSDGDFVFLSKYDTDKRPGIYEVIDGNFTYKEVLWVDSVAGTFDKLSLAPTPSVDNQGKIIIIKNRENDDYAGIYINKDNSQWVLAARTLTEGDVKELILASDNEMVDGTVTDKAPTVKQVNATFAKIKGDEDIQFSVDEPVELKDAVNKKYLEDNYYDKEYSDDNYAEKNGDSDIEFNVAEPKSEHNAVNLEYLEDKYFDKGETAEKFAKLNGDEGNLFKVKSPVNRTDAVNKGFADTTYAPIDGDENRAFDVKDAESEHNAVAKRQLDKAITDLEETYHPLNGKDTLKVIGADAEEGTSEYVTSKQLSEGVISKIDSSAIYDNL